MHLLKRSEAQGAIRQSLLLLTIKEFRQAGLAFFDIIFAGAKILHLPLASSGRFAAVLVLIIIEFKRILDNIKKNGRWFTNAG